MRAQDARACVVYTYLYVFIFKYETIDVKTKLGGGGVRLLKKPFFWFADPVLSIALHC